MAETVIFWSKPSILIVINRRRLLIILKDKWTSTVCRKRNPRLVIIPSLHRDGCPLGKWQLGDGF